MIDFPKCFELLTDNSPFAWQIRLYEKFLADEIPAACDIPTGLGKTSVIVIWILALAAKMIENPQTNKIPRRLVYVVDRRVIVDQATKEAEKVLKKLTALKRLSAINETHKDLRQIFDSLKNISFLEKDKGIIALSALRGEFADNREWCLDPSRPAIIVGTIDMIGSRLLFSAYGKVGKNPKSLQAGVLGQDSLIVTDEAHLSPSFVTLLNGIKSKIEETSVRKPFLLMQLSATLAGNQNDFGEATGNAFRVDETDEDLQNEKSVVYRRVHADKTILFREFSITPEEIKSKTAKDIFRSAQVAAIVEQALEYKNESAAILIYAKEVETVKLIASELETKLEKSGIEDAKERILTMTGGMRGKERDEITKDEIFQKFIPKDNREKPEGVWYLVATSTAEVGVNLDGDHAVCDLTSLDSLTQRVGRVNRFGNGKARIIVVFSPQQIEVSQRYFDALYKLRKSEKEFDKINDEFEILNQNAEDANEKVKSADEIHKQAKQEFDEKKVSKKEKDATAIGESEKARKLFDEAKKNLDELKTLRNEIKLKLSEVNSRKEIVAKKLKALAKELEEIGKVYVRPLALEEAEIFTYRKLEANKIDEKIAASPSALKRLSGDKNCYPTAPTCPPFDAARIDDWAMTSVLNKNYARPQVSAWIRGVIDDETTETNVCWRADLEFAEKAKNPDEDAVKMISLVQPTSREKARETTDRVRKMMIIVANELEAGSKDKKFYVIDQSGEVKTYEFKDFVTAKKSKPVSDRILAELFDILASATVVLPCEVGGLKNGLVIKDEKSLIEDKKIKAVDDVVPEKDWARYVFEPSGNVCSIKNLQSGEIFNGFADTNKSINEIIEIIEKETGKICVHQSQAASDNEVDANEENEDVISKNEKKSFVAYFVAKKSPERFGGDGDTASISTGKVRLEVHNKDVENNARSLAEKLYLDAELIDALAIAGRWHDVGKNRSWWQRAIGNTKYPNEVLAKSGSNRAGKNFNKFNNGYRHEFGSLVKAEKAEEINNHPHRDLILHLIAAHHGWARPHFPERAFAMEEKPEPTKTKTAKDAMRRFIKLQNEYGWWQLAYLEAILKAADVLASRNPSESEK